MNRQWTNELWIVKMKSLVAPNDKLCLRPSFPELSGWCEEASRQTKRDFLSKHAPLASIIKVTFLSFLGGSRTTLILLQIRSNLFGKSAIIANNGLCLWVFHFHNPLVKKLQGKLSVSFFLSTCAVKSLTPIIKVTFLEFLGCSRTFAQSRSIVNASINLTKSLQKINTICLYEHSHISADTIANDAKPVSFPFPWPT